jgi:hypothetical protein
MPSAAHAFRLSLESNQEFARKIDRADFPLTEFQAVQDWQRNRFGNTYADFAARESDRPACEFFLQELYGGVSFRERDEVVSRVEPIMSRLLPDRALLALSEALQLQRLSLDLDLFMAEEYLKTGQNEIDTELYIELYRSVGRRPERELQIHMIRKLGRELQSLTHTPVLLALVKAVRKPALAAGYGRLQEFLEKGLSAFRQLQDPGRFVDAIYQREVELMQQWFGLTQAIDPAGINR